MLCCRTAARDVPGGRKETQDHATTTVHRPPDHPTPRGTIHGLAGIVGFASLPLAGLLLGRRFRRDPAWRALARPSLTLGVLEYAALVLFLVSPGPRRGITERLLIILDLIW